MYVAEGQLAGVEEAQPPLGACDVQKCRDAAAGHGAYAAYNNDEQYLIGHYRGEGRSLNGRLEHCKQCTAHARKEGGDDKRQHLVLKQVNAHCFCRNFVIADGLERAAVG